jgi:hypothetical protein
MDIRIIFNPELPAKIKKIPEGLRMTPEEYEGLAESIRDNVKDRTFCSGKIIPNYTRTSILKARYLVLAYNLIDELLGFATLHYLKSDKIYLDVICTKKDSKGVGSALMDKIHEIAEKEKKSVFLKSVRSAMGFYEVKGYTLDLDTHLGNTNNNNSDSNNSNNNSNSNNSNSNSNSNNSNNNMSWVGLIPMSRKTLKNKKDKTKRRRTLKHNNKEKY